MPVNLVTKHRQIENDNVIAVDFGARAPMAMKRAA